MAKEGMNVRKGCAQRLNDFPGGPTPGSLHLFPLEPLLGTNFVHTVLWEMFKIKMMEKPLSSKLRVSSNG